MSLAAERDAIIRALAAADAERDQPYGVGESYTYDEKRQAFYVRACDLILKAQGELRTQAKGNKRLSRREMTKQRKAERRTAEPRESNAELKVVRRGRVVTSDSGDA